MKITNIITHNELLKKFIEENKGVTVIDWQPLIGDECEKYAQNNQPVIKVYLSDGNWLRVFISKEHNEINWY